MAKRPDSAQQPDLTPDTLVEKLRPDPSESPSWIEQCGFLGDSDRTDYCRLYWTRALTEYLEVKKSEIVYRDKKPDGGSRIWIKPEAVVTLGPPKKLKAADLQAQRATSANPSCPVPRGQPSTMAACVDPAMLFFMAPLIWWATVARLYSTAAFGIVGVAHMGRGGFVPSNRLLCSGESKIIHLGRREYKDISS